MSGAANPVSPPDITINCDPEKLAEFEQRNRWCASRRRMDHPDTEHDPQTRPDRQGAGRGRTWAAPQM
ncbi:MAG: hypothetical protein QF781_03260 [Phycisphaerales bacterium]|nr:hypothetical protein [Phycisphaerales bacterium]MDP6311159.1 hypothetical protein [Phycisphaerales bacterium]MDP7086066.1 hypothetical protein [Phycisphaerales bacterium]MDP7188902.1 hypothetical protein [Phycisphaerales bacterium]MDP7519186.1 hypothetical protein [Phycisphaerales bacterium]